MSSVLKFALILLAAAMLAVMGRMWFINSSQPVAVQEPDVSVLIAAADLPAGLLLRDSDFAWQAYPRSRIPSGALVQGSTEADLRGALLRHRVAADRVLLVSDVIRADTPGFLAAALKPGMRAVSVPVDDVSGNAGLIQPGDYVDMILTQSLTRGDGERRGQRQVVSETVVEHARIIAVGSSFQRQSDGNQPIRARTVTIEVAPRAAEAVTVAAQLGSLSMALRSFATDDRTAVPEGAAGGDAAVVAWEAETGPMPQGPVWGGDVSRALGSQGEEASAVALSAAPRRVVIMRGNQTQEQELGISAR